MRDEIENIGTINRLSMMLDRERKQVDLLNEEVSHLRKALSYYAVRGASDNNRQTVESQNLRQLRVLKEGCAELEAEPLDGPTCPITYPYGTKAKKKKKSNWEG